MVLGWGLNHTRGKGACPSFCPPHTSAQWGSARQMRAAAHPWRTPAWHTEDSWWPGPRCCWAGSCHRGLEGAGTLGGLQAGGCSGSSSWRWAVGLHLGRNKDREVLWGTSHPVWPTPGMRRSIPHSPLPDFWSLLSREREFTTSRFTKNPQSAHPTRSKPATLPSSLCRLLKSWVINKRGWIFCHSPSKCFKGIYSLHPVHFQI